MQAINITTKHQNIVLLVFLALFGALLAYTSITDYNNNEQRSVNKEYKKLTDNVKSVIKSFKISNQESFDSIGELIYEDRIKKALSVQNTRLYHLYQEKAQKALRQFAVFKGIDNIYIFDDSLGMISAVNRTLFLSNKELESLKIRLDSYKRKQIILHAGSKKNYALLINKISYTENSYIYAVVLEPMDKFTEQFIDYSSDESDYFLFTKDLNYKNSFIRLNDEFASQTYALQEDTLLKYNMNYAKSYNLDGKETVSKLEIVEDMQNVLILGMMNLDHTNKVIQEGKEKLDDAYFSVYMSYLVAFLMYGLLLLSKVNIFNETKKVVKKFTGSEEVHKFESKSLSQEAKKQAFSYINHSNSQIRNSVYNIYNSMKNLSPEDVRNISIKNSLSKENIRLVYQPVVDSKTLKPEFCEVFLRLLNYYGEELMPSEFIPVLNHFNMLDNLDEMMLEKVIKKIESLQSHDRDAKISINISKGAFESSKFLENLSTSLSINTIDTHNVMLELPFIELIKDEKSKNFVSQLTSKGIQFAVSITRADNSTMKKIIDNNIKYVKIDMMYFSDILENDNKQKALKLILKNAKKNGVHIIAERIETELMFKLAKSLDIELLQGYYISKPKKYFTHK